MRQYRQQFLKGHFFVLLEALLISSQLSEGGRQRVCVTFSCSWQLVLVYCEKGR